MSLKGALFEVDVGDDRRLDERRQLQVDLSDHLPIRMQATVVHVEGCNVGLDSIAARRRLIEPGVADPALLEREHGALVPPG